MSQRLEPQFGEPVNTDVVARGSWLPAGVYEGLVPSISGAGPWTVNLGVGSNGVSRWRGQGASGIGSHGNPFIRESAAVQVNIDVHDSNPRWDLIVGYYQWVAGPTDPLNGKPTGVLTTAMKAVYTVVKGTAAVTPVYPTVPDPDGSGRRPVILAKVYVPTAGTPTVTRWDATDFRLDYMRSVLQEITDAHDGYSSLDARLDAMPQLLEAVRFSASNQPTTGGGAFALPTFDDTDQYGTAINISGDNTFNLTKVGIYTLLGLLSGNGFTAGSGLAALKADLTYTPSGGSPTTITLDLDNISPGDDETKVVAGMLYVPSTWSAVSIQFKYNTSGFVNVRGIVEFRGVPNSIANLAIYTGNKTFGESSGQTYPDFVTFQLVSQNTIGKGTWSVVTSAGNQDGTTDPKAEIVNGNQLKWTWTTTPGSFPDTHTVKIRLADDGGRTVDKVISVTLNAYAVATLTDTTPDQAFDRGVYTGSGAYAVHFTATGTGGVTPYTWSLVAGVDTTLPSAAINSTTGAVTGSITGTGAWKVKIRLTDSASTVVDKVVNISVDGVEYDPGCVPAGTMVMMADGNVKPVELVEGGEAVMGFDERTLEVVESIVHGTMSYDNRALVKVSTDGLDLVCSEDHRIWSNKAAEWIPAGMIQPDDSTLLLRDGVLVNVDVLDVVHLSVLAQVFHFSLDGGHIFVAGGVAAHNMKPLF